MGLLGDIAGIFSATQERNAAENATRLMEGNRQMGMQAAQDVLTRTGHYLPLMDQSLAQLHMPGGYIPNMYGIPEVDQIIPWRALPNERQLQTVETNPYGGLLDSTIQQAQALDVGSGMSDSDRIAFEDAKRLMNENLSATGNLRSGAAGYYNTELARRVVADANERRFTRQHQKLQLLQGLQGQGTQHALARQQQFAQIHANLSGIDLSRYQAGVATDATRMGLMMQRSANLFQQDYQRSNMQYNQELGRSQLQLQRAGMYSGAGLAGMQAHNQMMGLSLGMAPAVAQSYLHQGAANANAIMAPAAAVDTTLMTILGGLTGGFGGAMMGAGYGNPMMMLSSMGTGGAGQGYNPMQYGRPIGPMYG